MISLAIMLYTDEVRIVPNELQLKVTEQLSIDCLSNLLI